MSEPIEVQVVQPLNGAAPRRVPDGPDIWTVELYPGSLDEAIHRLGLATEERWRVGGMYPARTSWETVAEAQDAVSAAVAEVKRLRQEADHAAK